MLVIAGCRPRSLSIEFSVRDCDASTCCATRGSCEHLSADEGDLDVIDPNEISSEGLDSVATPAAVMSDKSTFPILCMTAILQLGERVSVDDLHVLWIELSDVNVLDNHIFHAAVHAKTFSSNDTFGADTHDGLVGADGESARTCFVVGDFNGGLTITPIRTVDGILSAFTHAR